MKEPRTLRNEARAEAYDYFDKNIRPLPKDNNGKIDPSQGGFYDNDVDAFRHAYVSGVFAQEYGEKAADLFGRMNEFFNPKNIHSNSTHPESQNMDLWNNAVGRKYGLKSKDRQSLAKALQQALKSGEMITDRKDKRRYEGATHDPVNQNKPVIVLQEAEKGRNELFFDTEKKQILTAGEFIILIESGQYPGYAVRTVHGVPTPVSNPDSRGTNNLG